MQLNDHSKIEKDLVNYSFKLKYKRFIRITSWKLQVDLKDYTNFETSGKDTRKKTGVRFSFRRFKNAWEEKRKI